MDIQNLIQELNEEQKAPVLQTEGAVLVTAGAGSGKTRVLTTRIAYLISKGVYPYNILAITFTNKAANEMKTRVERIASDCQEMWVCTFHSMCVRILRRYADKLGYTTSFSIYGEQERENIIKKILVDLNLDEDLKKNMIYHIANAKNDNISPEEYLIQYAFIRNIKDIVNVYKVYQNELVKNNALDFDDLLIKTYELLQNFPEVREKYQDRFRYIHIDEFQDTNRVQYDIVKILSAKHNNIMVVGDEDQCIYGWRGANIQNIFDFKDDYKDVHIFKLEKNYRCTKNIIEVANRVIMNNTQRLDKVLYTDNAVGEPIEIFVGYNDVQEAGFIARRIEELAKNGYQYRDIAVLMRFNAMSRTIEEGLLNKNIPYKVLGGMKFYERMEIKNVLAYLKVIVNNQDNESLLRIINFPKRGIGSASINQLQVLADAHNLSIYNFIKNYGNTLPNALQKKVMPFFDMMQELINEQNSMPLLDIVKKVIMKAKIREAYLEKETAEDENRLLNIDSLLASVDTYSKTYEDDNLADYLQSITLLSAVDEDDDEHDGVVLATVHAVKGLEFRAVFVVGLEDENFPILRDNGDSDIEEERRLFYVAVTRAKEHLYLSRCDNRFKYGEIKRFMPSRFLEELKGLPNLKRVSFNLGYNMDNTGNNQNAHKGNFNNFGNYNGASNYNHYNSSYNSSINNFSDYNIDAKSTSTISTQIAPYEFEEKSNDGFVVGAKVEHPRFGVGEVVDISKLQSSNVITIDFEDEGIKNLSFDVSPLTLL